MLEHHAQIAERLLEFDLDLYALDYADGPRRPGLAAFARRRARQFGLTPVISDRALSRLYPRLRAWGRAHRRCGAIVTDRV